MSVVRGLVYKMNRMGPRTEPCGTPKLSKSGCEFVVGCNSLRSIGKVGFHRGAQVFGRDC